MGTNEIFEGSSRPSLDEVIVDLLEAIALEEMALGNILNAEGRKIHVFNENFRRSKAGFKEIQYASSSAHKIITDVIMKEWLLLLKLHTIMEFSEKSELNFRKKKNKKNKKDKKNKKNKCCEKYKLD